jgi:hypothetical protein
MYPPLDHFGKAYQESLLKVAGEHSSHLEVHNVAFSERLLNQLGDSLINLGEKVKRQSACPEMAQAKA